MQRRALISGAGIAGLTLAIVLRGRGWEPVVVEREPEVRRDGYMMDFFGTGWDVAERIGLVDELRSIRYPIYMLQYVDNDGEPWLTMPIDALRKALDNKYTYLRRSDLEQILHHRAADAGIDIRYGTTVDHLRDWSDSVAVALSDGSEEDFDLVFGADGIHSRIRDLVFGPESQFAEFLGFYVAAFHIAGRDYGIDRAVKLHEETDTVAAFYPLSATTIDATYCFRHEDVGWVPHERRLDLVRRKFAGTGWIGERVLAERDSPAPIYFDSLTQIDMPAWSKGRTALVGDACGCLTLLAGQGSHMAMAGAYVLAAELDRHPGDHAAAFRAYEGVLKPAVARKQRAAKRLAQRFVPSERSIPWLRQATMKMMFNPMVMPLSIKFMGGSDALRRYR